MAMLEDRGHNVTQHIAVVRGRRGKGRRGKAARALKREADRVTARPHRRRPPPDHTDEATR